MLDMSRYIQILFWTYAILDYLQIKSPTVSIYCILFSLVILFLLRYWGIVINSSSERQIRSKCRLPVTPVLSKVN